MKMPGYPTINPFEFVILGSASANGHAVTDVLLEALLNTSVFNLLVALWYGNCMRFKIYGEIQDTIYL